MSSYELIDAVERLNIYKAQLRGIQILEDEIQEKQTFCNERRPFLNELIDCMQRRVDDLRKAEQSAMVQSDGLWNLKRLREWTNTF